jgi:PPOX class probable F420-dependent enzyme
MTWRATDDQSTHAEEGGLVIEIPAPVRALLEQRNFWQFVTLNEDGSATASPVWAHVDGDHIIVNTATGRRKERNVRRDPRVVLAMVDLDDPYSWAEIRGTVVDMAVGQSADEGIERLSQKYLERSYTGRPGEERVLLRIEPTTIAFRTEGGSQALKALGDSTHD